MNFSSVMLWLRYYEPLVTLVMTLLTIGILIIAVCTLLKANKSIRIANQSLREAEKTRRDTFLPIVILTQAPMRESFSQNRSSALFPEVRNCGHGFAFHVTISVTGVMRNQKIVPVIDNAGQVEKFTVGLLDTELQTRDLSGVEFMVEYEDVFRRKVRTVYEVKQEKRRDDRGEFYEPIFDVTRYAVEPPD